jgi:16S rRNA (guanine966-N2)-methyltransferase
MRVVAGSARGARLSIVPGDGTRPILDRVKTALFDILRPRIAGMTMLDLFAGSGSVGIEALSQGAAHCTFIDRAHKAVLTIKKNLEVTGLGDQAEVLCADGLQFLKGTTKSFDLIYIAPPQYKGLWIEAMRLAGERLTVALPSTREGEEEREAGLAIVQIDPREYESLDLGPLREVRQKRYGNTLLVFYASTAEPLPSEE